VLREEALTYRGNARAIRSFPGYMVREGPAEPALYPAEKARGADVVLRRPWQRAVFIAGIAGAILLGLFLVLSAG
jgi:hypothetical protein